MERLLTVCIPTYNRKDVLIPDLKSYLSIDDSRFCIKVNDNCSVDGTVDALQQIDDDRFEFHKNQTNIGSVPNWMMALQGCRSEYVLFLLDKDTFRIDYLSDFLDYLEKENPSFGFVNLNSSSNCACIRYNKGIDSILAMAYLDKHPSGYFYRRQVFEEGIRSSFFQSIDRKFIFPFEVLNALVGSLYPSVIVNIPLIRTAAERTFKDGRSLSFNESNIWFGLQKRMVEFDYYIRSALFLPISSKEKFSLCNSIYSKMVYNVSSQFYSFMGNEDVCYHYYLESRKVNRKELLYNVFRVSSVYRNLADGCIPKMELQRQILIQVIKTLKVLVFI